MLSSLADVIAKNDDAGVEGVYKQEHVTLVSLSVGSAVPCCWMGKVYFHVGS
jgi:hypothetical protein